MSWHGKIDPAPARRLRLHVLTQISEVDGRGRLGAIREVVSVEPAPDRFDPSLVISEHAGRLGLL